MGSNLTGLRASHFAACTEEGLSEEEIDLDWQQVEMDLAKMLDEEIE
jgi:hypothetical protein